jgi:8-amino-7-oxononanoate synthase
VFSSGYAANVGAIAALADRQDAIYSDAHNHASMIDGCRLSRATVHVYPHGDWRALETLLAETADGYRRRYIITESVFSMHGDLAPLVELAELARQWNAALVVDEAHATGVLGPRGRGLAEALGVESAVHVRIGTLSKALGVSGGFVSGSRSLVDWLVNRARSFIFSTALPAAVCEAAVAALEVVSAEPARRQQVLERAAQLREGLRAGGWDVGASASQIVPVIVDEPLRAVRLSERLQSAGMLVPAMRPPSVPDGRSLLRFSLSAGHTAAMIETLIAALGSASDA